MKSKIIVSAILLSSRLIYAQDICQFKNIDIPPKESRLLELTRVIEFRCDSSIPESIPNVLNVHDTCLVVERYQSGKCISREMFSAGKLANSQLGVHKGVISFGWNMDKQRLVGVNATGHFRFPGQVKLADFHPARPRLSYFFNSSKSESRRISNYTYTQFPIIGICGIKGEPHRRSDGPAGRSSDQLSNYFKSREDSIIVYLQFRTGMNHENRKDDIEDQKPLLQKPNQNNK